jgi:hypothetical protein
MTQPMPPEGTAAPCVFCHHDVTLARDERTGARYWVLPGEPADGRERCYGGTTPRRGAIRTRHKPDQYAWWYDSDGVAQLPARFTPRRTA